MHLYRRKPIVLEAYQFWPLTYNKDATQYDAEDFDLMDMSEWPGVQADYTKWARRYYWIDTLEGQMNIAPGDWVVKGVNGEYWAVKPDIFEKTYEKSFPCEVGECGC